LGLVLRQSVGKGDTQALRFRCWVLAAVTGLERLRETLQVTGARLQSVADVLPYSVRQAFWVLIAPHPLPPLLAA